VATAILLGAGSGALHAVTGPDHVLSLGPAALHARAGSWRVGLAWGLGHAVGTLILAVPVLLAAGLVDLTSLAAWGDRLGGAALLGMAAWSWWSLRGRPGGGPGARSPVVVGLIHGATGAGSLILVLPVIVSSASSLSLAFLLAFAVGSTVAMAGLTAVIARVGARLEGRRVARVQRGLIAAAVVGGAWLVAA
jgi:hypothetical protein